MEREKLESRAANYPYLQGLWAIPMGVMIVLAGVSNLERGPSTPVLLGLVVAGLLLCWGLSVRIAQHYRDAYGEVTPTRSRNVRSGIAVVAFVGVLAVVGSKYTFWSAGGPRCVYAVAFALGILAYYAILVGLRSHHLIIWGAVCAAGLLPIWGGLGADRDPLAMIGLGIALMASGAFDQRLLARSFAISDGLKPASSDAGG